jgi:S-adenosylmethionine:tRNA ribosyltransferase-isomerase
VTAATEPTQRPRDARLLVIDAAGRMHHARRDAFVNHLRPGDLVIANDAATLPASLSGTHERTAEAIEMRLAARRSLSPDDIETFAAVVFGAGDFHTPTERRPAPPDLVAGDRLKLGPLRATVLLLLDHPRLVSIAFDGPADAIWAGIARHGRPIQYAHMSTPLALWDVWTAIAGPPVAFEPPSAGFVLDWKTLSAMRERGIEFASITHAAGISSTGDDELDKRLPFDEPYDIPASTANAVNRALAQHRRIVAIGTTVVRALEHAAEPTGRLRVGAGVATQRIGPGTRLRIVNVILSGVHEPATSHFQLLGAFADARTLARADEVMNALSYRTHEFGDSVLIERASAAVDLFYSYPLMAPKHLFRLAGIALLAALTLTSARLRADVTPSDQRKPAPRWKLPSMTGGNVQLADYKGKVLLLNFWATWCAPCRTEMPWFSEFAEKYKADGLEVVGISVDDKGWKVIKPFVEDKSHGINYTILHDTMDLTVMYKLGTMPKTVLIDRDGKVAAIHNGLVEKDPFEDEIRAVLGK